MNYDLTQSLNSFSYLKKYVRKNDRVLDFGSGRGYIAELISKKINATVQCVDVIDIKDNPLPLVIYDGKKLPFKDNKFDVSICLFVLHHSPDQECLLRELIRVTAKRIIVMEDLVENILDKLFSSIHKLTSFVRYNSRAMVFRSDLEWQKYFEKHNLMIESVEPISMKRNIFYPIHRKIYVLKPIKN